MSNQNPVDLETGVFGAKGDENDYEYQQQLAESASGARGLSGAPAHVLENEFSHNVRASMYRAWVYPEFYPKEPQPRLENWSAEDLEEFWIKLPGKEDSAAD